MPVFSYARETFPGESLSFRFFEPRYRLMCKRIIASGSMEFVFYSGRSEPRPGSLCHVLTVTKMEYLESEDVYNVEVHCQHKNSRSVMTDYFVETETLGLAVCRTRVLHDERLSADSFEASLVLARKCDSLINGILASSPLLGYQINNLSAPSALRVASGIHPWYRGN